jgi:hypothetical protein
MAAVGFRSVSVLTDLDALSAEHLRCGDLDGGVDGDIVWFACTWGASIVRRVNGSDCPGRT